MLAQFSRLPPVSVGCAKYLRCSRRTLHYYVEQCGALFQPLAWSRLKPSVFASIYGRSCGQSWRHHRRLSQVFGFLRFITIAVPPRRDRALDGIKAYVTASEVKLRALRADIYVWLAGAARRVSEAWWASAGSTCMPCSPTRREPNEPLAADAAGGTRRQNRCTTRAGREHAAAPSQPRRRRADGTTRRPRGSPPRETPAASSALTARPRRSGKEQ